MRLVCENCGGAIDKDDAISVSYKKFRGVMGMGSYEDAYFCSPKCLIEYTQKKMVEAKEAEENDNEVLP
jgi:hypothetical protein